MLREFNGYIGTSSKRNYIEVTKRTKEEKDTAMENRRSDILKSELDGLIGFRKVFDALATSKVPVVGHNLYLDLCYIYHNFFGSLPDDVNVFKQNLNSTLTKNLFDTKLIAERHPTLQVFIINLEIYKKHQP
jgi:poly(A)-specific ribonuclease